MRISQRDVHGEPMVEQILLAGTAVCGELMLGQIYPCGTTGTRTGEKHQGGVAEGNFFELTTNPLSLPIHPTLFRVGRTKRNQE